MYKWPFFAHTVKHFFTVDFPLDLKNIFKLKFITLFQLEILFEAENWSKRTKMLHKLQK